MIVGATKKHQKFLQVLHSTVRDKNISLKARGLLCLMLSYPTDWNFSLQFLVEASGEKISIIRTSINELIEHGYIHRHKVTNSKGRIVCWEYIVYESNNIDDLEIK